MGTANPDHAEEIEQRDKRHQYGEEREVARLLPFLTFIHGNDRRHGSRENPVNHQQRE
jgi:hypothetical protein